MPSKKSRDRQNHDRVATNPAKTTKPLNPNQQRGATAPGSATKKGSAAKFDPT